MKPALKIFYTSSFAANLLSYLSLTFLWWHVSLPCISIAYTRLCEDLYMTYMPPSKQTSLDSLLVPWGRALPLLWSCLCLEACFALLLQVAKGLSLLSIPYSHHDWAEDLGRPWQPFGGSSRLTLWLCKLATVLTLVA